MPHPKNPNGTGFRKPQQLEFPWREEARTRDVSGYFVAHALKRDPQLRWQDELGPGFPERAASPRWGNAPQP
jgi:hypothetical protein